MTVQPPCTFGSVNRHISISPSAELDFRSVVSKWRHLARVDCAAESGPNRIPTLWTGQVPRSAEKFQSRDSTSNPSHSFPSRTLDPAGLSVETPSCGLSPTWSPQQGCPQGGVQPPRTSGNSMGAKPQPPAPRPHDPKFTMRAAAPSPSCRSHWARKPVASSPERPRS